MAEGGCIGGMAKVLGRAPKTRDGMSLTHMVKRSRDAARCASNAANRVLKRYRFGRLISVRHSMRIVPGIAGPSRRKLGGRKRSQRQVEAETSWWVPIFSWLKKISKDRHRRSPRSSESAFTA